MNRSIALLATSFLLGAGGLLRADDYEGVPHRYTSPRTHYDGHPYQYSRPLTYYNRHPFRPNLNYDGYPPRRQLPRAYASNLVPRRDDHFDYFDHTSTRLESRPYHRIRPPYYPSAYLLYRDQLHYGAFNHAGYP
jgi:hypothetical protein